MVRSLLTVPFFRLIHLPVLITGTSVNGIGFEAARVIAKYANLVIITGYNAER